MICIITIVDFAALILKLIFLINECAPFTISLLSLMAMLFSVNFVSLRAAPRKYQLDVEIAKK